MRLTRGGALLAAGMAVWLLVAPTAVADDGVDATENGVIARSEKKREAERQRRSAAQGTSTNSSGPSADEIRRQKVAAWLKAYQAAMARNDKLVSAYRNCVDGPAPEICRRYLDQRQPAPASPNLGAEVLVGIPYAAPVVIPPEVIAYQAVAELTLTPPRPVVGPPPEINPWKTAVVGYPLWLTVDGDHTPPAVSDSIFDVSVSLRARLTKVVFDLGDGQRVTCTRFDRPWTRSVPARTSSPDCGHTYQQVPKGSKTYRVTAYATWAVDWQLNGETGTLPFFQSASTDLPVSELQVLVR